MKYVRSITENLARIVLRCPMYNAQRTNFLSVLSMSLVKSLDNNLHFSILNAVIRVSICLNE